MNTIDIFIENMPKVELHLHIEGSLEPEMLFSLAHRNAIAIPFQSVDDVRRAYHFSNLQDFLDIYYQGMNVLRTEQDFYDLTMAYLQRIHAQHVIHTEIFFDPQGHTERGVSFDTVISGITRALDEAKASFGITSKLIMCFLRHLSEDSAHQALEQAIPYKNKIFGVGLDSSEIGHPPSKFSRVFEDARKHGFIVVAHAGEEGPPEYIWQALDDLKIQRIDHGNRALEDAALVKRIVADNIALTVCPLSNLKLCVVTDMKDHPIKSMLDLGLMATVNSDDPSYFGGYMNENYKAIAHALDLSREDIITLAENGIQASFITDAEKESLMTNLNDYAKAAT